MASISSTINNFLSKFDLRITKYAQFETLINSQHDLSEIMSWPKEKLAQIIPLIEQSNSQLYQDLFVLTELNFKENGFFVEFGATNGKDINNTFLLEKKYNWTGIVAEPAKFWHKNLEENRNCIIEKRCVWRSSGEKILFSESEDREYSSISEYSSTKKEKEYEVETISLTDMLQENNAPEVMDYLSIDTEGSEYEILNHFDFTKYKFRVITCEHNYSKNREKIAQLLGQNGYKRKFIGLSKFDDWYILSE